jgi:hypothetical protein
MTIIREEDGDYLATSASEPGRRYRISKTVTRCSCRGFQTHQHCRHIAGVTEYIHTYETRLALMGVLDEPDHLQHTLATQEARRTVEQMSL